jgi:hypothetical protein
MQALPLHGTQAVPGFPQLSEFGVSTHACPSLQHPGQPVLAQFASTPASTKHLPN